MKGVHILDVLAKTTGLYHVPELRNLDVMIELRSSHKRGFDDLPIGLPVILKD